MKAHGQTHLDETDRRLLAELEADGRLTQVALAARVGLSRTQCRSASPGWSAKA